MDTTLIDKALSVPGHDREWPTAAGVYCVPEGPWNADVWLMEKHPRHAKGRAASCRVDGCGVPAGTPEGSRPRKTDVLCLGHHARYRKQVPLPDLQIFIAEQATAKPIRKSPPAATHQRFYLPVDFTRVHPLYAQELRYMVATKVRRGQWSDSVYVNQVLRTLLELGRLTGRSSLLESPDSLAGQLESVVRPDPTRRISLTAIREAAAALPGVIEVLTEGLLPPWERDTWRVADLGVPWGTAGSPRPVYWGTVTCGWLRGGLKTLARQHLQAGTRSFATLQMWTRGGGLLSRFIEEMGGVEPAELTRPVFLDFLGWAKTDEELTKTDLNAVNCIAQCLLELRTSEIVPDLPETMFLLRGENPVRKQRAPKPFPADLIARIDEMIAQDSLLPEDQRLMLRVLRATGPRVSELLLLPRDCVRHVEGRGFSLEYFMSKVQDWRRIPITEDLGRALAIQAAAVADKYGEDCRWMFPYLGRSPRTGVRSGRSGRAILHWTYQRFSQSIWAAYRRNGIGRSSLTGEQLTGAALHRFRHTIATGLLNSGWSQYEVQKFLGHKSATMSQAYAEIHDDTLAQKYKEFVAHAVDVDGVRHNLDVEGAAQVERLRDRVVRSTLPNGYCTLPEKQQCEFIPTPCLSCKPFFRTTPVFLGIHIRQRNEAVKALEQAKADGRQRAVDANQRTIQQLDTIIVSLQQEKTRMAQTAKTQDPPA
jgi:integrase